MLCTRRAVTALFEHQIPAGEHEPSCSVTARLAPLLARRLGDFESKQAMAGWFDRQVAVALAGICQYLSRGGKMAPVDDAALGELYSTALQSFDGLKDGVAGSDEEAIKGAVELLMQVFDNPDFGFAAHMLPTDAAGQRSASLLGHAAPLPYPLNAEHYMTLVLATFDPDEVGLLEPHSSEQLQVLLRHQTRLGLSEQQHQLCMVRCHYLAYLRAVTTDYSPNVEESLGLLQNAVAEFKAGYEGYEQTDVGSELEGSVLSSLLIEVTERLADYHATFTENELYANTIRGNFELLVELKFAHLESFSKELKKARQAMVLQLTKSSVRTFYRRLADALAATQEEKAEKDIAALEAAGQDYDLDRNGRPQRRGGGAGEEEEDEGTALADLAEFLAEEAVIPVIERADQFSPFCAKAPHVAVKELVRCFGSDLKQLVSGFKEMGPAMETLLQSVGLLIDAAAELLGEGAALSKLHKSVVMPFVPLVEKDLRSQRDRFDKLCRQSIENENWSPVNQDSSISSSVYDIFAMIGQQIPVMLGSGLLLDDSIAKQFIRNIDSCVMAYALHVSQGIADPPPVVSRVAKKKRRGSVDAVADLARAGSGGEALEEEDEEAIDDIPGAVAAFEEPVEETVENCVRLNSLFFAADRVVEFSEQFAYAMELDPQTAPDDRPFAGSLEIVEQCREGALAYVSAKIVCFELAEHFYRGLYVPTPSEARFGPQVLENLEDFMGELVDLVTEPLVFKALLGSILDAVVATTEELLRRGGPTRTYQPTDVAIFYEDFAELESWFMAGGKGLELEEIEERTMKLHKIADGQKFASGKDAVPKSQEQTKKSGATQEKLDAVRCLTFCLLYASHADALPNIPGFRALGHCSKGCRMPIGVLQAKKRTEDSKEKARKELAEAKAKTKESMSKMNDQSKAAMRKMMKPGAAPQRCSFALGFKSFAYYKTNSYAAQASDGARCHLHATGATNRHQFDSQLGDLISPKSGIAKSVRGSCAYAHTVYNFRPRAFLELLILGSIINVFGWLGHKCAFNTHCEMYILATHAFVLQVCRFYNARFCKVGINIARSIKLVTARK